ncbi:MAG TPA: hypothetical protein VGZ22_31490 [Isosphaeraceae bacterium]|nr:hypothetical protein [Isosphaeraceae bacterium]
MASRRITADCEFELDDGFERRLEDGSLCFSRPGQTVWVAVYDAGYVEPRMSVESFYDPSRQPDRVWEREEPGLYGRASMLLEQGGEPRCWTLTALTASPLSIALFSFYFDDDDDLAWALDTWRSIRFRSGQPLS